LPATEAQQSTIEVFGSLQSPPADGEGEKPTGGQESAPDAVHVLPRLNGRAASQRIVIMSCILLNEVEVATLERLGGTISGYN